MAFPGNQYKLLALDLDGTLLNEKNQVSPRDAQAVRRAQERGAQTVLCTGRNVRAVRASQFFSGLSLTHCEDILALCEEFETDPCLYTTQSLYYGGAFRALLRHLEQGGQIVMNEADEGYFYLDSHEKWLKALENEALPFTKAVLYPSHDISDLLISRLKHMGSFEIAPSVMFGGELHNIEINRRGVNKGQGLRWLAKELGCTMENLAAIGDSDNDLTMLRAAGLGIAMANSRKNVRLTADVVTGSNTENGVAQAIERYILEEKL